MERVYQFLCKVLIFMCLLYCCVDGASIGRSKLKKSIQKRIEKNGFDIVKTLENLNSGYQYISSFLKNTRDGEQVNSRASYGSSALSGVPNCDDCFLGMQVSRREAYVVSSWNGICALNII